MGPRNAPVSDSLLNCMSSCPHVASGAVGVCGQPSGHSRLGSNPCDSLETCLPYLAPTGACTTKGREGPPDPNHLACPLFTPQEDSAVCLRDSSSLWTPEWYWASCLAALGLSFPISTLRGWFGLSLLHLPALMWARPLPGLTGTRTPPALSFQEVCHPARPRQHQESNDHPCV